MNNLQVLNLYNNAITGTLPTELGNMNNLGSLFLNNNFITGIVPTEIGEMAGLTSLTLHENDLEGMMPDSICDSGVIVTADSFTNPPEIYCSCCLAHSVIDDCDNCDAECSDVDLALTTDDLPEETSFSLRNIGTDSTVWNVMWIYESRGVTTYYTSRVCPTNCYHFSLEDPHFFGSYHLEFEGELVSSGGEFTVSSNAYFGNCE